MNSGQVRRIGVAARLATAFSVLFMLSACGKKSRFDEKAVLDVCQIASEAEAEGILGQLTEKPKPEPQDSGMAGNCTWRFESASGADATLSVMVMTHASSTGRQDPDRWFEMSLSELKASLDPHPLELKKLGDRAFLFEFPKPGLSEILMRQSRTYAILKISGANSSQLRSFAGIVAREAAAKEETRDSSVTVAADARPRAEPARSTGEPAAGKKPAKDETTVLYTMGFVEECKRADDLLRKSCARWGQQLSDENRQYCDLPAETFEARTSDSYRAFKQTFSEQIKQSEAKISPLLERGRADFDRQFAKALSGSISGFDLETLSRLLGRECSVIETEWLTQQPR